jgi:hypothetical protein
VSENVGASTSRNPKGLHGLYGDNFIITDNDLEDNYASYAGLNLLIKTVLFYLQMVQLVVKLVPDKSASNR